MMAISTGRFHVIFRLLKRFVEINWTVPEAEGEACFKSFHSGVFYA